MFTIDTPIKNLYPAKAPASAFGEIVETVIGGALVCGLFAAFLWSPVLIEWLDHIF